MVNMNCPSCGSKMNHKTKKDKVCYKDKYQYVIIDADFCSNKKCKEVVLESVALQKREEVYLKLKEDNKNEYSLRLLSL